MFPLTVCTLSVKNSCPTFNCNWVKLLVSWFHTCSRCNHILLYCSIGGSFVGNFDAIISAHVHFCSQLFCIHGTLKVGFNFRRLIVLYNHYSSLTFLIDQTAFVWLKSSQFHIVFIVDLFSLLENITRLSKLIPTVFILFFILNQFHHVL